MKVGDLVRTRWETDVRKEDKWHDHKVHGRRHRIGIILPLQIEEPSRKIQSIGSSGMMNIYHLNL
jgi:hypothetical protein